MFEQDSCNYLEEIKQNLKDCLAAKPLDRNRFGPFEFVEFCGFLIRE
jgi:hypothetical protein